MNKPIDFIMVDGSSYLYRAFYALPPLTNSKGQATGAIYGVINMLKRLKLDYQPTYMAVVFDAKGKTFRDDLFKAYKAQRPGMPDDLRSQIQPLQDIVKAMGFPLVIIDGVEADDVIATLAIHAKNSGLKTLISTGDKDIAQIIDEDISCINTMSNTLLDTEGVINKFGIPPSKIIDYLSLIGDKVDNIPGIPSVGPKTAVKWLTEYENLEGIIANADKIKGKVGEKLRDNLDTLELSKLLVTLKLDVPLTVKPNDLVLSEPDTQSLKTLYTELEFKSFLSEILKQNHNKQNDDVNYETVLTKDAFEQLVENLKTVDFFAFDTETTSLNYIDAQIVGLSICYKKNHAYYIPVAHKYPDAPTQLDRNYVLQSLQPFLESKQKRIIGQNLKYDKSVLRNHDIELTSIAFDTMLESYILNSASSRHDMDTLALKYLGKQTIHYEDVAGKGAKQKNFSEVDIADATKYAAEDADITLQLHETLWPKLQKTEKLKWVFENIELPLSSVLSKMECYGVLIDKSLLQQQSQHIAKRMDILANEAFDLAGEEFNMNSTKQLQQLFFEKLKLPILKKTPKGQPSTAEPILQELALDFPLPKLILEYRSLAKLKSTYTDALPEQINAHTGRVHTSYNQAVTATGRLSSTSPNLQNIPIRTEEGRKVRKAFIAPKGFRILAADYSQIELRIMAHLSDDKGLVAAFADGLDIHKATAAEVFGVALESVSSEQRRKAKAINFGLIYGMSNYGLAKQIQTDAKTAQEYIDLYFHRYPGVKIYMEQTRHLAHEQGYVETIFGRRLYLPEISSKNFQRRSAAERAAINAPMQGSAADIIKIAMLNLNDYLDNNDNAKMIMQVHDELVFEIDQNHLQHFAKAIKDKMEHCVELKVPLIADVGIGDNWDEAH